MKIVYKTFAFIYYHINLHDALEEFNKEGIFGTPYSHHDKYLVNLILVSSDTLNDHELVKDKLRQIKCVYHFRIEHEIVNSHPIDFFKKIDGETNAQHKKRANKLAASSLRELAKKIASGNFGDNFDFEIKDNKLKIIE